MYLILRNWFSLVLKNQAIKNEKTRCLCGFEGMSRGGFEPRQKGPADRINKAFLVCLGHLSGHLFANFD